MSTEPLAHGLAWTEGPEIEFRDADGYWSDENETALGEAIAVSPLNPQFSCPLCHDRTSGFDQEAIVNATADGPFVQRAPSGLMLLTLKPCGHTFRKTV